ncbi:HAMP domain-containing histidine kinase [Anaerolineae bacterium CFX7]|nr:HAMP domain-containing histidine kinase [Anaerolineae bacterium CFX7]
MRASNAIIRAATMLVLDLRAALFGVLLVLLSSILLALWLDRRFRPKSSRAVILTGSISSETRLRPLLNDLAHELRMPLAVLLTHLEVQRSPTAPSETKQESLRLMQAETRRMSRMVSNILELARMVSNILELAELETRGLTVKHLLDFRALAAEVVAELQPFAQERAIELTLDSDESVCWVNGEAYHLKQVLLNLTDNAIKYSRPHDRVEISLARDLSRKKIVCQVSDTGPGMTAPSKWTVARTNPQARSCALRLTRRKKRRNAHELETARLGAWIDIDCVAWNLVFASARPSVDYAGRCGKCPCLSSSPHRAARANDRNSGHR